MKIGVRLFVSSMVFAIAVAAVYWLTTRDVAGVGFLLFMVMATVTLAGYVVVAEKEANLSSDAPDARSTDDAGQQVGVFALESYWPIVAAASVTLLLPATVFLPGPSLIFVIAGFAGLLWSLRFLAREST